MSPDLPRSYTHTQVNTHIHIYDIIHGRKEKIEKSGARYIVVREIESSCQEAKIISSVVES